MTKKEKSSKGNIGAGVLNTAEYFSLIDAVARQIIDLFLKRVSREDLIAMWEAAQEGEKERIEGGERQQRGRIKGRLR